MDLLVFEPLKSYKVCRYMALLDLLLTIQSSHAHNIEVTHTTYNFWVFFITEEICIMLLNVNFLAAKLVVFQ